MFRRSQTLIVVSDLTIEQGTFALRGIAFTVPSDKYCVLMGKTGCGKTSILEAIAGLRPIVSGKIVLDYSDVSHWTPGARGIGYVPQDGALFPTMTVREQLGFALAIRNTPRPDIDKRTDELANWLGIHHLLDRKPHGLSGGESQRVALGRALSFRPRFLLMDEPLSSLDDTTRAQLIELLRDLRNHAPATVLHVTHSQTEAEQLADTIFRLEDGCIRGAT
jgi:ABC-type sugar transport system ATPase subunit